MSLRRLLAAGLSAATGRLRFRSLSTATAASHPPWAMVNRVSISVKSSPPTFHLAEPPRYSYLEMSAHLINTSDEPGPDSDFEQLLGGHVSSSSGADGLLLLVCCAGRLASPILAQQGGKQVRHRTGEPVHDHVPDFTYIVCNPLSGQLSRVPSIGGTTKILRETHMGLSSPNPTAAMGCLTGSPSQGSTRRTRCSGFSRIQEGGTLRRASRGRANIRLRGGWGVRSMRCWQWRRTQ